MEFDSKNSNRNKINKSIYSLISNIIVILCSQIIEFSYFLLDFQPKCDAKSLGVIKFKIKIFKLEWYGIWISYRKNDYIFFTYHFYIDPI